MKKILCLMVFAFIGFTSVDAQSDRDTRQSDRDTKQSERRTSDRDEKGNASFEDTIEEMTSVRNASSCNHMMKVLEYIQDNLGSDDVDQGSLAAAIKGYSVEECRPTRGCDCREVRNAYNELVEQLRN